MAPDLQNAAVSGDEPAGALSKPALITGADKKQKAGFCEQLNTALSGLVH